MIAEQIVFDHVPAPVKQQAIEYWTRKWRRLQSLLAPFAAEQRHLRLALDNHATRCEARAILMLPTGTLVAYGRSRGADFAEALDEVADRLASEIRRHKGRLRHEYLYHRRRTRREDFSGILPTLEQCHAIRAREGFAEVLRPALRGLSEHARRELIIAQLEGVVPPGEWTVSRVLDEVITRAWQQFDRRPGLPLEHWLTRLLHGILDEKGREPRVVPMSDAIPQDDSRFGAESGWVAEKEPFWPPVAPLTMEQAVPADDFSDQLQHASGEEQQRWILSQLQGFSRQQRRAFALYNLEGWNADDIAALQSRSPQDVLRDVDQVREALGRKLITSE